MHLGDVEKTLDGNRVVFLDYTFPFIYVPQDDFLMISEFYAQLAVSKLIPDTLECTNQYCYFKNRKCSDSSL